MSDWVIHFVHDRNPENEGVLYDNNGDGWPIPLHADEEKAARFDLWEIKEREAPLESDAGALSVVLRILDDGHIRCGWSMRGGRPTIYGPRAACCFTEMPLFALLNYARTRSDSQGVDVHGIALRKNDLFIAGGRPVVYGLSGKHRESGEGPWPRYLDASCGIAHHEQYRYVAMNLRENQPIDWSHEREWRWADVHDQYTCPGLPVWLQAAENLFSHVILVVRTREEADQALDKLKLMRDAGSDGYDNAYCRRIVGCTRILALEETAEYVSQSPHKLLRLDDVPVFELMELKPIVPTTQTTSLVQSTVEEAKEAAEIASKKWRDTHGRGGLYGSAYVMIEGPRTEHVEALLQLGEVVPSGGVGYCMHNLGRSNETLLLEEAEATAYAAKAVLQAAMPDASFHVRTVLD